MATTFQGVHYIPLLPSHLSLPLTSPLPPSHLPFPPHIFSCRCRVINAALESKIFQVLQQRLCVGEKRAEVEGKAGFDTEGREGGILLS